MPKAAGGSHGTSPAESSVGGIGRITRQACDGWRIPQYSAPIPVTHACRPGCSSTRSDPAVVKTLASSSSSGSTPRWVLPRAPLSGTGAQDPMTAPVGADAGLRPLTSLAHGVRASHAPTAALAIAGCWGTPMSVPAMGCGPVPLDRGPASEATTDATGRPAIAAEFPTPADRQPRIKNASVQARFTGL